MFLNDSYVPDEVMEQVFFYCNVEDLIHFACCSSDCYNSDVIWKLIWENVIVEAAQLTELGEHEYENMRHTRRLRINPTMRKGMSMKDLECSIPNEPSPRVFGPHMNIPNLVDLQIGYPCNDYVKELRDEDIQYISRDMTSLKKLAIVNKPLNILGKPQSQSAFGELENLYNLQELHIKNLPSIPKPCCLVPEHFLLNVSATVLNDSLHFFMNKFYTP